MTWTALAETTCTTQTYSPTDRPACGTTYRIWVWTYGDGSAFAAVWGTESSEHTVSMATCPPAFEQNAYHYFIRDTASAGNGVGTVTATDTLTYRITWGNDAGKFAIKSGTADRGGDDGLHLAEAPYYTLTVEAVDGNGGTATARRRWGLPQPAGGAAAQR